MVSNDIPMNVQIGEMVRETSEGNFSARLMLRTDTETELSVIIQNTQGRTVFQDKYQLDPARNSIAMDLPELSGGLYHAWIEAAGKTYIRTIEIPVRKKAGIVQLFRNLLSGF